MSVAASSMNHDPLMSDINFAISPKAKKDFFELEMFGTGNKPLRKTNTVIMDQFEKKAEKQKKILELNKVINNSSDSDSMNS